MSSERSGIVRVGVHAPLEAAADALLKESLSKITRSADKSDILTPWKEQDRRRREVYVTSGTPDPATRRGIFGREWNPDRPHLNSTISGPQKPDHGATSSSWDNE